MSASEQLRELETAMRYDSPSNRATFVRGRDAEHAVLAALPEIVAVIKAAENFVPHIDDEGGCHPDRYGRDCPEWLAIPLALAALEEKLKP